MTENIENENQCECLILREFAAERGFDLNVPDIPGTTGLIRCQNIGTINEDGHYLCPEDARTCGMIYVPDPENSLYYQKKKKSEKKKKSKKEKEIQPAFTAEDRHTRNLRTIFVGSAGGAGWPKLLGSIMVVPPWFSH